MKIIFKPHAYLQTMTKMPLMFQRNRHKSVAVVAHYPFTLIVKWLSSTCRKSGKNYLRIISKPNAYLPTMIKTPLKFQWNMYQSVGGVAHKKNPLSIHFDSTKGKIVEKVTKNYLRIISKPYAYLQTMTKNL